MNNIKSLNINGLIPKIPLIQGGMSVGISLDNLASAVANEGAIGIIGTAGIGLLDDNHVKNVKEANMEGLKKVIRKAREKTKGIIGVNIMTVLTDYKELVTTAIKEEIDLIISGAGLPLNLPSFLEETSKTKLVPIVSSLKAAQIIFKKWWNNYKYIPDAFVLEGPKAGGHLGYKKENLNKKEYQLEATLPQLVDFTEEIKKNYGKEVPVIAAGGIDTPEKVRQMFSLGASGIQVGTPFIATKECDADIKFKEALINAKEEDIVIIESPVGLPGRAIKNKFIEEVEAGIRKPFICNFHCIKTCNVFDAPYCIAQALLNAAKGNLDEGFVFTGQYGYKINKISTVKDVINYLFQEI
ncbi:2-nitropropane dioxygenase [Petrotoga sp. 9PWA.NaAc.5.4]|nr:nitronate monooxygenase family protein [Petrotoga sp. 9PWA.NaAc.5.4]PNR96626.1 2-nitropropane dioxygenase [Petrotoga sp. 9PWA.NaAc.5.4]